MEQWVVPLISLVAAIEWVAIVIVRRKSTVRTMRFDGSKVTLLDLLVLLACVALLVSSVQYFDTSVGSLVRVTFGVLRVTLLFSGAYILLDEYRRRRAVG